VTADWALLLGEAYDSLAAAANAFAGRELAEPSASTEGDEDAAGMEALTRRLIARLGEDGLLAWSVPPAWRPPAGSLSQEAAAAALAAATDGGGLRRSGRRDGAPDTGELDVRSLCLLREVLAYHSGIADVAFVMQGLGSFPVALAGSEELKGRWLPAVGRGEAVAAFALTEPDAGSDLGSISLRAGREGNGYLLDGVKTLISNGPIADLVTVIARTAAGGSRGLSAFAVPGDLAGLDKTERLTTMAPHPLGTLRFTSCRVPAEFRLGEEGEGAKIALATLGRFRPTVGGAAVGFATRALDEAVHRSRERRQFGRPLAEFEGIQSKLADMATEIEAARLLVCRAAVRLDAGERAVAESSMAKLFATEVAARVADEAVQIHGGLGVVRGTLVERIYREVRAMRIYEGTSEIQRSIIARELIGT
jgi:acyl-CoA dehydrogenase